jgi:protein-tyrosine phosphatase
VQKILPSDISWMQSNLGISDVSIQIIARTEEKYWIINVARDWQEGNAHFHCPLDYNYIPATELVSISDRISELHRDRPEHPVVVHCIDGQERSPLAVAFHLWRQREDFDLNEKDQLLEIYEQMKEVRPTIIDRTNWVDFSSLLEEEEDDEND